MNIATQTSADFTHIAQMIDGMHMAMLSTIETDGTLASRPMTPLEMDSHGAIWFFIDQRSSTLDHFKVANLAFADFARGTYVSLSGSGEIDTHRAHIERLWTPMAKPWFPDGPASPSLALLKFVPQVADYWDASSSRMVRAFGLIASVVTGKPLGMGEHGSHTGLSAATTVQDGA